MLWCRSGRQRCGEVPLTLILVSGVGMWGSWILRLVVLCFRVFGKNDHRKLVMLIEMCFCVIVSME